MSIERVRVIGIAVKSLKESAVFYENVLGLEPVWQADFPEPPIEARVLKYKIGDLALNLMEPTRTGSAVDRFIERRGEGLFSLVVAVSPGGLEDLRKRGLKEAFPQHHIMENADFGGGEVYERVEIAWNDPRQAGVLLEIQELQ